MVSTARKDVITVRVLVAAFLDHAETYYVKNGRPTNSAKRFQNVARPLLQLYGSLPVDEFGPAALDVLRSKWIESRKVQKPDPYKKPEPLSREYVNQCIGFIKQIFKWGVEKELVKPETHYALCQLAGIKKGRSRAKELPKIKPVDDEVVEETLPFLPSPVAAMVRLQRLTAMRPGEVRAMRACDIDTTQDEWFYIPWEHKTEHHDIPRMICLGPKCQAILTPYLMDRADDPEKWLFSPREAMAERHAKARERRKTPVQPSQLDRSKPNPQRLPGEQYTKDSYRRAIQRAAEKAGIQRWFPNQLRHTALTAIRAKEGVEAAQVMASHKNIQVTEIYAEKDISKARELARKYA